MIIFVVLKINFISQICNTKTFFTFPFQKETFFRISVFWLLRVLTEFKDQIKNRWKSSTKMIKLMNSEILISHFFSDHKSHWVSLFSHWFPSKQFPDIRILFCCSQFRIQNSLFGFLRWPMFLGDSYELNFTIISMKKTDFIKIFNINSQYPQNDCQMCWIQFYWSSHQLIIMLSLNIQSFLSILHFRNNNWNQIGIIDVFLCRLIFHRSWTPNCKYWMGHLNRGTSTKSEY